MDIITHIINNIVSKTDKYLKKTYDTPYVLKQITTVFSMNKPFMNTTKLIPPLCTYIVYFICSNF